MGLFIELADVPGNLLLPSIHPTQPAAAWPDTANPWPRSVFAADAQMASCDQESPKETAAPDPAGKPIVRCP